jgi:hypothetical protein
MSRPFWQFGRQTNDAVVLADDKQSAPALAVVEQEVAIDEVLRLGSQTYSHPARLNRTNSPAHTAAITPTTTK